MEYLNIQHRHVLTLTFLKIKTKNLTNKIPQVTYVLVNIPQVKGKKNYLKKKKTKEQLNK